MRPASLATALLVAVTALVGPGLAAQPAGAVAGRCEPGKGVTVVVDYGPLRSGIDLFCATDGGGRDAAEIMRRAGVSFNYTAGQPFVCRIQGLPGSDRESCTDTPPPDAYWGLFTSDGSSTWSYASQGAASQTVRNGGSVGWRFQDGGDRENPGTGPTPRPAKAEASPKPSPKPSPAKGEGAGPSGSASPTPQARSSASQGASASASASARSSAASAKGAKDDDTAGRKGKDQDGKPERRRAVASDRESGDADASSVTDAAAEPVEEVEPLSAAGDDTGSAGGLLPLLIGGLAVLGLGTYAAIAARRRRV